MDELKNVARTHIAQAAGIPVEQVKHTPPCECCGLHMQYAVTEEAVFFHPWGGEVDELRYVTTVRCRAEADSLIEHLANGPEHPMNVEVTDILNEAFPRLLA